MRQTTVQDWMHEGVITCRPETLVDQLAATLEVKDISAVVVVDEAGDAIGVVSRTDLVNASFIHPCLQHWRGMTAEHLMSKPVISVSPDAEIREAVELLQAKRIHRLVVVKKSAEQARPVGILSVTDLAKHIGR